MAKLSLKVAKLAIVALKLGFFLLTEKLIRIFKDNFDNDYPDRKSFDLHHVKKVVYCNMQLRLFLSNGKKRISFGQNMGAHHGSPNFCYEIPLN